MILYEKGRDFIRNLFDALELNVTNFLLRMLHLWHLQHDLKKTDTMSLEYKKEIKKYWQQYTRHINPLWHKLYSSRTGICDVRFIPDHIYYTVIDQHFNNRKYYWGVNDKNYFQLWFPDAKQPKAVVRKINDIFYNENYELLTPAQAIELCLLQNRLVIKPSLASCGGKGIVFWNKDEGKEKLNKSILDGMNNLIIQEVIVQHEALSIIHTSSINTIRIMSLLFKGEVHILSSVLRMGINGKQVDNLSSGGIACGIEKNGRLKNVAYSDEGTRYEKHPQGFDFKKWMVPSYKEAVELVKREAAKMAHFKLVSWDIAIDREGIPILIEANLRKGGCNMHQMNNGPLFGDLTDEVLSEVYKVKTS